MIILTSNGLSSDKLISETKKHIRSEMKNAAIITTASVGYKEKDWHNPRLVSELAQLKLSTSFVDIEFENPEKLLQFDILMFGGGNPFYLLHFMKKTNCKDILLKFLSCKKIIIGVSAGSVVLETTCGLIYEFDPQLNDNIKVDLKGLNLVDADICPHYSRYISRYDCFNERIKKVEKAYGTNIIKVNDGEGIFIENQKVYAV